MINYSYNNSRKGGGVMKLLTNDKFSKVMKVIGNITLALGAIVIVPTSLFTVQQPKCPKELLK
jgi:cyclic lactone autoinducer peptide